MSVDESRAARTRRIMGEEEDRLRAAKATCEANAGLVGLDPEKAWFLFLTRVDSDLMDRKAVVTEAMVDAIEAVEAQRKASQ